MAAENTRAIRNKRVTYTTTSGEKVPGVTTILGLRAKPALIEWAFKIGKEHPELSSTRDYLDDLARIGQCAHAILSAHLLNEPADLGDFTPRDVEAAQIPVAKYHAWALGKTIKVLSSEEALVSNRHRYGGTLDLYAEIDGRLAVLDFKTSARIYPEHLIQDSAYAEMVRESGRKVDDLRILQIGRNAEEGFSEKVVSEWSNQFAAFMALRTLYDIEFCANKDVRWIKERASWFVNPEEVKS